MLTLPSKNTCHHSVGIVYNQLLSIQLYSANTLNNDAILQEILNAEFLPKQQAS